MKPVFNLEPKYRVTMLTREELTSGPGTPPAVKGLIWFTDGSRLRSDWGWGQWAICRKKAQHLSRKTRYSLSGWGICNISLCSWNLTHDRPEKYVSICSDSQAALKALQPAKTSPLVRQCQKALNTILPSNTVGLYWVPGHAGLRGNEIADKLTRDGSVQKFVEPEPFSGVSRQNIRRKIICWMDNQHLVTWCGPCSTQRQAQELISGPDLATRAQLLSFNRTQSRVVIGLLTGHNTQRWHLYVMGLSDNPICRKCGTEEETSAHVSCACEALASPTYTWASSFWTLRISGN